MSAKPLTEDECLVIFEQLARYADRCANRLRELTICGKASDSATKQLLAEAAYSDSLILGALADASVVRCGGEARKEGGGLTWLAGPRVAAALSPAVQGGAR